MPGPSKPRQGKQDLEKGHNSGYISPNDKSCPNCRHAKAYEPYLPMTLLVCHHPAAIKYHGGLRACLSIVRRPGGACQNGGRWTAALELVKKKKLKDEIAQEGMATTRRTPGQGDDDNANF